MHESELPVINVPHVIKPPLSHGGISLKDGYIEYEVSLDAKKYWESLSEREQETLCNIALKQNKDLRDIITEQMQQK